MTNTLTFSAETHAHRAAVKAKLEPGFDWVLSVEKNGVPYKVRHMSALHPRGAVMERMTTLLAAAMAEQESDAALAVLKGD